MCVLIVDLISYPGYVWKCGRSWHEIIVGPYIHTCLKKRCRVKHVNDGQCGTMELREDDASKCYWVSFLDIQNIFFPR